MKNINEEEILSVTEELDHLLREMDNMTYPARKQLGKMSRKSFERF